MKQFPILMIVALLSSAPHMSSAQQTENLDFARADDGPRNIRITDYLATPVGERLYFNFFVISGTEKSVLVLQKSTDNVNFETVETQVVLPMVVRMPHQFNYKDDEYGRRGTYYRLVQLTASGREVVGEFYCGEQVQETIATAQPR